MQSLEKSPASRLYSHSLSITILNLYSNYNQTTFEVAWL